MKERKFHFVCKTAYLASGESRVSEVGTPIFFNYQCYKMGRYDWNPLFKMARSTPTYNGNCIRFRMHLLTSLVNTFLIPIYCNSLYISSEVTPLFSKAFLVYLWLFWRPMAVVLIVLKLKTKADRLTSITYVLSFAMIVEFYSFLLTYIHVLCPTCSYRNNLFDWFRHENLDAEKKPIIDQTVLIWTSILRKTTLANENNSSLIML